MKQNLFDESFCTYRTQMTEDAVRKLQAVDRTKFLDGSYKEEIEHFTDWAAFDIATLHSADRKGKRRKEKTYVNDHGQRREIEYSVIDVTIPFSGDRSSFSYGPSSRTNPNKHAEVQSNALLVIFPDDETLDMKLNYFIRVVEDTLQRLQLEMINYRSQLSNTLDIVANQKIAEAQQQADFDKNRSFPID